MPLYRHVVTGEQVLTTPIGTDVAAGDGAAFVATRADVATANTIVLQVQTTDATQLGFYGQARVRVAGKLTRFRKGA